jgi:hypothetical protein
MQADQNTGAQQSDTSIVNGSMTPAECERSYDMMLMSFSERHVMM